MGDFIDLGPVYWPDEDDDEAQKLADELLIRDAEIKKLQSLLQASRKNKGRERIDNISLIHPVISAAAKTSKAKPKPPKKKYIKKNKTEYKSYPEINPNLFDEIINENRKNYSRRLETELYPFIESSLEIEVLKFVFKRTLDFNKSREKIAYKEFVLGKISNEGNLISAPTKYSHRSIERGVELAIQRKVIFTYRYRKGDTYWFFLNTAENQIILENIEAGNISESDLFKMNNAKVKELRRKKLDTSAYPEKKFMAEQSCQNDGTVPPNLQDGHDNDMPESIDNTTNTVKDITTNYNNSYKKQHKTGKKYYSSKNPADDFLKGLNNKEKAYVIKLITLEILGEKLNFDIREARRLVELKVVKGRSIFEVIDDQIKFLPYRKKEDYSWESILNKCIKEDRPPDKAYITAQKEKQKKDEKEKYLKIVNLWYPEEEFTRMDKEFASQLLNQAIKKLGKSNDEKVIRKLQRLIRDTEKLCDFKEDLPGFAEIAKEFLCSFSAIRNK